MNFTAEDFFNKSLRENTAGIKAARIMAAALKQVDSRKAVRSHLSVTSNHLVFPDQRLPFSEIKNIYLLAIGKAAIPMGMEGGNILGAKLSRAIILTKQKGKFIPQDFPNNYQILMGSHPVPDETSQQATKSIQDQLSNLSVSDLVIVLLSGGGSSLLTLPPEGINIADLQKLNQILLNSGANIQEINTIRKHVSLIKGGQLSRFLAPAKVITLILSDVIGDPIDLIASGPTYPDPSTFADALAIVNSYRLKEMIPGKIINHLELGTKNKIPDTPKPGDDTFSGSSHYVIAGNQDAILGAEKQARQEGFQTIIDCDPLIGEAKHVGEKLGRELIDLVDSIERPTCLISGGETTVTLSGTKAPRMGGRNLELALSASFPLAGLRDACLITLATDGEDGTSPAAGAVVTGDSQQIANDLGLNPKDYLDRHDSYAFFEGLDDLITIGSTQTNVNDLCFRFLW